MMKCCAVFVSLLLAFAASLAPAAEEFKLEEGFVRLDNGKDMTGWIDPKGDWTIVDGAIHLEYRPPGAGVIWSEKTHSRDCTVRLQYRASQGADSGVFIHGRQFQVRDYENSYPDTKKYAKFDNSAGQWNDLEFDIADGLATVKLNGQVIQESWKIGSQPDKGIGLQKEKGDFDYRYVRVKEKKAESRAAKPNVILIVADDLGYGQVSSYPHEEIYHTPNIDRLARGGVRMTDGYSAHPMCWPSRGALLTGRYYQRFLRGVIVPPSEKMIAQYLGEVGHVSACVGKWHNTGSIGQWDGQQLNHPRGWGFDEFFGFLGGMHDYWEADLGTHFKEGRNRPHTMPIYDGTKPVEKVKYLTEEFTDRAVDFIGRHKDRPFFLYLPYNAVHTPLQAPEKHMQRNNGNPYAAMVDSLDEGVGRVLDTLDASGLAENTLVIFVGDNGGYRGKNWKLRGEKSQLFEGGIRVPFVASWPQGLPAGKVYAQPVMHIDVMPTILGAAGVAMPEDRAIDGANLLPHWRGEKMEPPHEVLYWGETNAGRLAVRRGDWKLIKESEDRQGEKELALYNLREDIEEQRDLLGEQKQIADELSSLFDGWRVKMAESHRRAW